MKSHCETPNFQFDFGLMLTNRYLLPLERAAIGDCLSKEFP
jgi:hypothetical protein